MQLGSQPLTGPAPASPAPPGAATTGESVGDRMAAGLVETGVLRPDQLALARRIHDRVRGGRTLSAVLLELGFVTEEQIRQVLRDQAVHAQLGGLLVELGLLQPHDLQEALALQAQRPGTPLGEILTDQHFVSEADVIDVLADTLGLVPVALDRQPADAVLVRRAGVRTCRQHAFVPVSRDAGRVLVAFADPLDRQHVEAARAAFGPGLVAGIASRRAVLAALTRIERELTAASTASAAPESATVAAVNRLIEQAIARRASDIHLEPHRDRLRVRFRQDGVMVPYEDVPADQVAAIVGRIKVMAGADIAERRRHQDGRIHFDTPRGSIDIRVSFYVTIHGEKVVMRLLNNRETLLSLRDLGLAPRMREALEREALDAPSGVVMVTGPTGSGKTTTLYAAVNHLNDARTSIITAEDPVEYIIDGIAQCSINPKIDLSYAETLKHIVRQDPDVIVIGEIRDQFSAEVAINAALTGHKVLTTFHTEDSIGGLIRLLNMNIEAFLVSSTVISVVAQRLVRRVCTRCAEPQAVTPGELARLGVTAADAEALGFVRGRGCPSCRHTGYRGRLPVFELLVLNELVRDAVLARRTAFEIRRICLESSGLVTLLEDGLAKAAAGLTTFEELVRQVPRLSRPRPIGELRRLLGVHA